MRTVKALLVGLTALPLAASLAPAASAATTFHGTFTGKTMYEGCTAQVTDSVVSGNWNVILGGANGATPAVRMFEDGKLHVAYGGVALGVFHDVTQPGQEFSIQTTLANGSTVTMTLVGSSLSYVVSPYTVPGVTCSRATVLGQAG